MDFLDDTGLVKLWQHIQARFSNKVKRIPGKVLSSNDLPIITRQNLIL